jgi:hypothetical protein
MSGTPSLGFHPSSRYRSAESTHAGFPSPLRSVLDVSHVLDGLLLHRASRVSYRLRPPDAFAFGFILSCAWPLLQSFSSRTGPALMSGLPSLGLHSLIAASSGGVHWRRHPRPTPFRPRRFSRPRRLPPPSDFAGLFHPAATSRVRSSGVFPGEKPCGLIARRCPRVVTLAAVHGLTRVSTTCARLQGLAPLASPLRHTAV